MIIFYDVKICDNTLMAAGDDIAYHTKITYKLFLPGDGLMAMTLDCS